jgi:S1-C subfamily serine protease
MVKMKANNTKSERICHPVVLSVFLSFLTLVAAPAASPAFAADDPALRPIAARGPLSEDEQDNIAVFRKVSPSVVHITTLEFATNPFTLDVTQVQQGTGTGFVWDMNGHIVTNFHVIQGGDAARVTLADQSSWKARLVGVFPDRDLAVLRIDAPKGKLKPIPIGESGNLLVGQKVYAIGNPFGLDQTLTVGIVSALDREIESVTRRPIRGVIQTDAAINPGNSGGPLLDSAGRLIGVNTAIYSPSGASAGIGFAIPVDEARRLVPRLIRDGRIIRPVLGISGAPDEFRQALGLPPGVPVIDVDRGGPADRAGFRPFQRARDGGLIVGDLIVAIDGQPIGSNDDLLSELERRRPGETINVTVMRGNQRIERKVVLGSPGQSATDV